MPCLASFRPATSEDGGRQQLDAEHLIYENTRPGPGGRGAQILTPLELVDRLAALVPPPRVHRHRYYGVLAPNSPLRPAVTAMALPAAPLRDPAPPVDEPAHRRAARYAWALLLARVYEVFPLRCPLCGAEMRIIAFITEGAVVRDMLIHLGEPITPRTIAPARGPPLWEMPRPGQRSTILTSQLPVDQWHEYLNDPTLADAILDRVIHQSHRLALKGESLRKKTADKGKS